MSHALLPCVEIEPKSGPATHAVVWMHGLGADGHDFEPVVPWLRLPEDLAVRFVFPHAPAIPVTLNGGFVMPAWYDIYHDGFRMRADERGMERSARAVAALLERERQRGVPASHLVLAGFSQGGSLALHLALRFPERLAGAVALSSFLVGKDRLEAERSEANRGLPLFLGHGFSDPMVPIQLGLEARELLERLGHAVEWHSYPMEHQVCMEEIRDLGAWLAARFSSDQPPEFPTRRGAADPRAGTDPEEAAGPPGAAGPR